MPARFAQVNTHGGTYARRDQLTVAQATARLMLELDRLGAGGELLSTNLDVRLDGLPRSGQRAPEDPGVAVYFRFGGDRCFACDRWNRVADNIAAIAAHIAAIRAIDRYGVGTMEQAFAGYAALPASSEEWWLVLGVGRDASADEVDSAYRRLAREHHPDVGGDTNQMARLNAARDAARRSAVTR
jgi:hypothetical protein